MLQPRHGSSPLVDLVEGSPELFGGVLQYLDVIDLRSLRAACHVLRRVTRDEAMAADIQVRGREDLSCNRGLQSSQFNFLLSRLASTVAHSNPGSPPELQTKLAAAQLRPVCNVLLPEGQQLSPMNSCEWSLGCGEVSEWVLLAAAVQPYTTRA